MSETERVAIVGSREGADLEDVDHFVHQLWLKHPDTILVSGGAKGVDERAEARWLDLGGVVESYRPVCLESRQNGDQVWAIEKWELGGPQPRMFRLEGEPHWADFKSAATYRDILIAEAAQRLVAFFSPMGSRGAGFTAEMSEGCYERPTYRYYAGREAA